jgi:alpha-1,3-rhamnosyl/mannosyltransferase
VLAGYNRLRQPESLDREIQQASLDAKVHCLGYVADDALPALYRRALLACYLSTYEGYGIPPLEALASGTAVVVSPGQALDDLWPDYPYRCEAWDQPALVQILRRALLNDEERQALEKAGPGRIRQLSWQLSAQALLREFAKCLPASSGQPTGAAG